MKRKWKQGAAVGLIFSLLLMHGWAAGFGASYDATNDTLSIWDRAGQNLMVIRVIPQEVDPDQISAEMVTSRDDILYVVREATGEEFLATFGLSDRLPAGRYRVDVFAAKAGHFLLIKPSSAASSILETVNKAATQEELQQILESSAQNMGLESEIFQQLKERICALLFAQRPVEGYTLNTFMQAYGFYEGIVACQTGAMEYSQVIEEYMLYEAGNMQQDYMDLTQEQRLKVDGAITKVNFAEQTPQNALQELYFLAQVESAGDHIALRDIVESFAEKTGKIDMTEYDLLANQYYRDKVFSKLFGKKEQIMGIKSLAVLLKACIGEIEDQQDSNQGGGGAVSGGGGKTSGGAAGDYTYTPQQTEQAKTEPFSDIAGHWAAAEIQSMQKNGWIDGFGDGTFRPDEPVTRAEFTKLIVEMNELEVEEGGQFQDVAENDWYYSYISKAVKRGLVFGLSENLFGPNEPITRQDAAVIAYRFAVELGMDLSGIYTFEDMSDVSSYAVEAVEILGAEKLLQGYQNKFRPQDSITRAETAVLLAKIMERKGAQS